MYVIACFPTFLILFSRFKLSPRGFAKLSVIGCLLLLCLCIYTDVCPIAYLADYFYLAKPVDLTNNTNKYQPVRIHYYDPPVWVNHNGFDKCSDNCFLTVGKRYRKYSTSQFVIFHAHTELPSMPPKKVLGQTWILHNLEPPYVIKRNLKSWNGKFNWTLTYRRDSDIIDTYGTFLLKKMKTTGRFPLSSSWETKTKGNAWFVSDPNVPSKRAEFAKEMSESINVDIYGKYSKLKCPSNQLKKCHTLLRNNYKFYLAFENSLCRDYVTEKGFKMYQDIPEVIPVVRGTTDYSIFLPPNSYIDTTKFSNISSLVDFQKKLARNKSEFEEYFQWRKYFYAEPTGGRAFCALCKRAHNAMKYKRLYGDIETWMLGKGMNEMCREVTDIRLKPDLRGIGYTKIIKVLASSTVFGCLLLFLWCLSSKSVLNNIELIMDKYHNYISENS